MKSETQKFLNQLSSEQRPHVAKLKRRQLINCSMNFDFFQSASNLNGIFISKYKEYLREWVTKF